MIGLLDFLKLLGGVQLVGGVDVFRSILQAVADAGNTLVPDRSVTSNLGQSEDPYTERFRLIRDRRHFDSCRCPACDRGHYRSQRRLGD